MKILIELFITFFKIGMFTFGGGYAMIPLLQAELVNKKKWTDDKELMDYYCIGQSTPGIIAVNVATFIGYKKGGISGAIVATLGMIAPSLAIIMSLAHILKLYMENEYVSHAFAGVRIVVVVLILEAIFSLWKKAVTDWQSLGIFGIALVLLLAMNLSPIAIVLMVAAGGMLINRWRAKK